LIRRDRQKDALDFLELWNYKDLLWVLAERDVKLRYKQTLVGAAWVVFQPLVAAGIFSLIFNKVAGLPGPKGVPYFVFSYASFLAWNLFSSTLTKASSVLVQNSQLISKIYFPRLILPLSVVVSSILDFAIGAGLLIGMLWYCRICPGWEIGLCPIWLSGLLLLGIGLGLFLGSFMVFYRDVQYVVPFLIQVLTYISPVGFTVSSIEHLPNTLQLLFWLNPISALLDAARSSVLNTPGPDPLKLALSATTTVGVFFLGMVWFRQLERRFADVI